jgi:Mce-associated membrane protein
MVARRTDGVTGRLLARACATLRQLRTVGARRTRRSKWLLPTLALVALLSAVLPGYLGARVYQQHQVEGRDQDILAAARQLALNFTSLDYRHYDRDAKNVLNMATGSFRQQFADQTSNLTKLVATNKSVSQGQILDAGIARADARSASVLVAVDSKVTNVAAPKGQARNYRLQVDLVLRSGRWLASNVEFVG